MKQSELLKHELKNIINNLPFAIVYLDLEYKIIYGNKAYWDFLNIPKEEILGKPCYETVGEYAGVPNKTGKEKICSFCKIEDALRSKKQTVMERLLGDKFVKVTTIPEADDSGNIYRFMEVVEDITEYNKALNEVRIVNQRLQLANKSARLGVWDWHIITNHMVWDDRMLELYGLTKESFPGGVEAWERGLHPEDHDKTWEECQAALRGEREWDTEFRVLHPYGTVKHIKANGVVIRNSEGLAVRMLGINQDITERKLMEETLRLHSEMMKNMSEGVFLVRLSDGIIVYTNPKFEKMFGYEAGEMIGKHVSILNAPTDKKPEETANEIIEGLNNTSEWHGEVNNITKDGIPFWTYVSCSLLDHSEYGKVSISLHTDITDRKKAEEKLVQAYAELETRVQERTAELQATNQALAKSEKQLKDISSSLAEGIYVMNEQGNIIFLNPEAERLLGWTMKELMNKNAHELVHYRKADGSSLSFGECNMLNVIRTGIPFVSRDEVFVRKDGTTFPISVVASPIVENGKVVASVTAFRDITERKQIERERDKLIVDLQEALVKVKQLSGLLPICSSCKKIRDDKGYWNQMELYIRDHSEAEFSHGICPECAKKLYPDYYDEIYRKEDK